jgi:hypothetical protein
LGYTKNIAMGIIYQNQLSAKHTVSPKKNI